MRAQYFRDITDQGIEAARQMAFLVGQGHDAVFSDSYKFAREAFPTKLEIKMIAKARLEKITGMKNAGPSASDGSSPE